MLLFSMKRASVLLFLLWPAAPSPSAAPVPHVKVDGRDVAIWKPAGAAPASGYPVIVFSHGFTGCNTQSTFLMDALARAGYLVVAPNHQDARCGTAQREKSGSALEGLFSSKPEQPFKDPGAWSDQTYKARAEDIRSLLDSVLRDKSFGGVPVDAKRVGLAGHSLGGYTVLGLAGAWPSWRDKRAKAVLALSAYCNPYVLKGDLEHLGVPVMYQGGTRDFGITPAIRRFNGAYDVSSAPKVYVEFEGAGHFAWTDLNHAYTAQIDEYSVAFFNRYLKGETDPDPLLPLTGNPLPKGVSYLRSAWK